MRGRQIKIKRRTAIFFAVLIPAVIVVALYASHPGGFSLEATPPAIVTATFSQSATAAPFGRGWTMLPPSETPPPTISPTSAPPAPTLSDFWNGAAQWVLEIPDTGLPVGESDTIDMGNGVYWSYLHASTQSAGVVDSCGAPVEFPGCVTRWISTDGGQHFALADPHCMLECDSCPCDDNDRTWQQQYPRVTRGPTGVFYMVFEHGAAVWFSRSTNGTRWSRPSVIPYTGTWLLSEGPCTEAERIGPHPFIGSEDDCMAGGPPGLIVANGMLYMFLGLGQSPGHMGCFQSPLWNVTGFSPCPANPLFSGAPEYGPLDAMGAAANPYFDFRFVTSADVVAVDGTYYMTYEGIRGPNSPTAGRDNQFGLGFARAQVINGPWEKYPGNPALDNVLDNWGIGHADLLIINGVTYMYTGTPQLTRGRYVLVFK